MEQYPKNLTPQSLLTYWTAQYAEVRMHPLPPQSHEEWEQKVDHLVERLVVDDLQINFLRKQKISRMLRETATPQAYRFITISYPKSLNPTQFVEAIRKWQSTKWKWGSQRLQRLEFTGAEGYHPHIHMMVFTNKKPSQIVKELSSKTKLKPNFIDVLNGRYKEHLEYIKGQKRESKLAQMASDEAERNLLGLEEYEEYT